MHVSTLGSLAVSLTVSAWIWAFTAFTFPLHIWGLILNHFSSTPWVLQALLECLLYSNSKVKPYVECFNIHISNNRQFLKLCTFHSVEVEENLGSYNGRAMATRLERFDLDH